MFCFRFKAIMHPMNQQTSKRTTLALLLMAWFFALALAIPKMMVYKFTIVYGAEYLVFVSSRFLKTREKYTNLP